MYFTGISKCYTSIRDIFCNNASRADNCIMSDCYSGADYSISTYPCIIPYMDVLIVLQSLGS